MSSKEVHSNHHSHAAITKKYYCSKDQEIVPKLKKFKSSNFFEYLENDYKWSSGSKNADVIKLTINCIVWHLQQLEMSIMYQCDSFFSFSALKSHTLHLICHECNWYKWQVVLFTFTVLACSIKFSTMNAWNSHSLHLICHVCNLFMCQLRFS